MVLHFGMAHFLNKNNKKKSSLKEKETNNGCLFSTFSAPFLFQETETTPKAPSPKVKPTLGSQWKWGKKKVTPTKTTAKLGATTWMEGWKKSPAEG